MSRKNQNMEKYIHSLDALFVNADFGKKYAFKYIARDTYSVEYMSVVHLVHDIYVCAICYTLVIYKQSNTKCAKNHLI